VGDKSGQFFADEGAAIDVGLEEGVEVTGQVLLGGSYVGYYVACRFVGLNGRGCRRGYLARGLDQLVFIIPQFAIFMELAESYLNFYLKSSCRVRGV
jgi:hypothetical protein